LAGCSRRPAILPLLSVLVLSVLTAGCAGLRYANTTPLIKRHIRASQDPTWLVMFKSSLLCPARDVLTLDPLWRLVFGDEAWNGEGRGVADSSFCTDRWTEELTPAQVALGPCTMTPPQPPFRIDKIRDGGAAPGFIGRDAQGRSFLFKLDHPDYPELGTSATVIGSRILWALGYNVPPIFLVRIESTGDARFDGRRASAALFLDNVRGHFHFDWFRYRRELRGLRLASAWINDSDRVGTNTLVVVANGVARYYLIDFDSCLGSWQGRPKEPWRGHRYAWELGWLPLRVASLGLLHPEPDPQQPISSPAVGRFDARFEPLRWRSQAPNTAFDHMTERDLWWMVERIGRLRRPHIEAIVAEARLSSPGDARHLVEVLWQRRERIMALVSD
jgi:hypothetical protein